MLIRMESMSYQNGVYDMQDQMQYPGFQREHAWANSE